MTSSVRYILQARAHDGAILYITPVGPSVTRSDAVEFPAEGIDRRCANASEFYRLTFEAIQAAQPAGTGG